MKFWIRNFMFLLLAIFITIPILICQTGEVVLDETTTLIEGLQAVQSLPGKYKVVPLIEFVALLINAIIIILRLDKIKPYLWDKIASRWRVIVLIGLSAIAGIITSIAAGTAWYTAIIFGTVYGGRALINKKVFMDAVMNK